MKRLFVTALFFLISVPCFSQLKKAHVKDLAFLSGTWVQKSNWGNLEEYWSMPEGESMLSSFRCIKDGKPIFYEFVVIEQDGDLPVMKMRHFNKGNIAWESKDSPLIFQLTALDKDKAVFYSSEKDVKLTYQRVTFNKLDVTLDEKDKAGKPKKEIFNFTLKK